MQRANLWLYWYIFFRMWRPFYVNGLIFEPKIAEQQQEYKLYL
jgi:hypothetical protein